MTAAPTAADLLVELVRAPTVTPFAAPALDVLERHLAPAGFSVERPVFSELGAEPVENLFASIGSSARHLTLAGHVDVVPPGAEESWAHPPFAAKTVDGVLYGRGAVDMKGGLAAMVAASLRFVGKHGNDFGGRLSFLVTGDEEGAAVNGTAKLLDWAARRGEHFTAALVGEPTSANKLGDQIKIGRRGSFSATLVVEGTQGHAAYPERADNPVRGLTQLLYALQSAPLDAGTEHFGPSSLEVVSVDVGNPAWNIIPAKATARFNSRYNDAWTRESLQAKIEGRLAAASADPALSERPPIRWRLFPEPPSSDVFLTRDDDLIGLVSGAIEKITGRRPALSTSGGTSDARFIKNYCPVVEFGPVGSSMHQIDEHVPLAEIEATATIYEEILSPVFSAMNIVAYIRDNLAGAWQVMLGRSDGLSRLDTSLEGFWRSFGAVILVAPFGLLALISEQPILAEAEAARTLTGGAIALFGIALLVDWFTFPLVFALLAKPFGLGPRYVPFIVARNWSAVIIGAMVAVLHALHLFGALPSAAMPFAVIVVTAVALRFAYVIARTALVVSMTMALPIVVLDFVISLFIWSVFDRVT